MIDLPKLTGREFRPWDWYGWFMSLVGICLIATWGSMENISWFQKICMLITISFVTLEYFWRVAYGRVYKYVYYDTIIHTMYEITVGTETYYICSDTEDDLDLYMELHYPNVKYSITEKHSLESFIKREHYQ